MGAFSFSVFLLVMVLRFTCLFSTVESKTYFEDIAVLKDLKNGLDPGSISPGSCVSSWDFKADPCDSLFGERFTCGFRCDVMVSGTNRLTELALDQAGYNGSLANVSWNLPFLENLDLSNNLFSGTIPDSLSNLTRLRRLSLSGNSFSGEIPTSICSLSNLEELYMDNNNLQGKIPSSFNSLGSLKRLELQSNRITGEFPDLGSLKTLYYLDVSDNGISGELPSSLPASLVEISMRNNSLEGTFPENFRNLKYLQVMDLSHNNLSGSIPSLLFEHPSLQQITLSFNHFSTVKSPSSRVTQSSLIAVDLSNNNLEGLLPSFMASMPNLSALSLEKNKFRGMIPINYAMKTVIPGSSGSQLVRLLLGGNYLFGPIPDPLLMLKQGSANVKLDDNCLYRCPKRLFFCEGDDQKSFAECRRSGPIIP